MSSATQKQTYNPLIAFLTNISACERLKILDCKGCNLKHVDELATLKKLQHLNLKSINGFFELTQLKNYILATQTQTYQDHFRNLKSLRFWILRINEVNSINQINSHHIKYLVLVNCSLLVFDLPLQSTISLKEIEIYSQEADNTNILKQIKAGLKVNLMCRNNMSEDINEKRLDKFMIGILSQLDSQKLQYQKSIKGMRIALLIHLSILLIIVNTDISPQTNCLFHKQNRLFMLLDLKNNKQYHVNTQKNQSVYFNFCDAFTLPECKKNNSYLGYLISADKCQPLTSSHPGKFEVKYDYHEKIGQNVLEINYQKDALDKNSYRLKMSIICSQKQLEIVNSTVQGSYVQVLLRSIHGCPVYQIPALMQIIDQYQLLIAIGCFLVGFLFLFFGRVMIHVTAFFSMSTVLIISLTFLCFYFMEQNVKDVYLYLTLTAILIGSLSISYLTMKFFLQFSFFFVGALFAFFIGTFVKAFLLAFMASNTGILFMMNSVLNFVILAIMILLGILTLQHKSYVIIYSSTITGSYLIVRGFSLLIGGFPCEFQIYDLILSKKISSVPISFYIYLLFILLLTALGGIYQQLKLKKQRSSSISNDSKSSLMQSRFSSYIETNLDQIHDQLERIIDRYRNSQIGSHEENRIEQSIHSQQLNSYSKMRENQEHK